MKKMIRSSCLVALLTAWFLPLNISGAEGPESLLHGEMETINHNFRLVNRQYGDPTQKASTLTLIAEMQKHAEKARTLTPPRTEKLAGADQTRYVDTFHKDLDALIKEMGALQHAVAADKVDVAKAEIDKIAQLKAVSHKELGVGDGRKRKGGSPPPGQ
jgi:soluble cytochrome b562